MLGNYEDYADQHLTGVWEVSKKIDGVQAIFNDKEVLSRSGKPLYNLDMYRESGVRGEYEIYLGDFKRSLQAVRTKSKVMEIPFTALFKLNPVDDRLKMGIVINFAPKEIVALRDAVIEEGYEGLIFRQGDKWIKAKKFKTYDVKITGLKEGGGKNKGKLGAFETDMGNVGIFKGFPESVRGEWFKPEMIGRTIEVLCMELTEDGMFRMARLTRFREDKD